MTVILALALACSPPGSWAAQFHTMEMPTVNAGAPKSFVGFNVSLLSQVPIDDFPGPPGSASDICGYVSPSGREYAVIGFRMGMGFVEVTNPASPVIVGYIDGGGVNQPWRDSAIVGEYAYIVTDGDGVGLQVADLTDIDNGNVTLLTTTDLGAGMETAHNISPGEAGEYVYLCLSNVNNRDGLIAVDVSDPSNPFIDGTWDINGSVGAHDVQVVTWPSGPLAGRELAFASCEASGFYIGDVTDKSNMTTIGFSSYPNRTYAHQGWLSEDRTRFYLGDELDELIRPGVTTATTYVFDVSDPTSPGFATSFTNGQVATDHNMMVRGDFLFEANYTTGLRVYDTSLYPLVVERGHFDTVPATDGVAFAGAWGVDASLPSGIVILSDQASGLFVFDVSAATTPLPPVPATAGWPMIVIATITALAGGLMVRSVRGNAGRHSNTAN